MDWGTFFTWLAQGLIAAVVVFVVAAVVVAIIQHERGDK